MPRTWSSPMIPETPTTGAAVSARASRIRAHRGSCPTETTGLDGGTITTSASAIASSTPGPGFGSSMPIGTTAWAGTVAWWRIQYSWKCTALRSPVSGSSMTTWVSTRSSVIGSRSTPGRPSAGTGRRSRR